MILLKEDLKDIGHKACCGENDNTIIVSYGKYHGIEHIIIRNLLLLFGDYTIVEEWEQENDDYSCDWFFETNLPWSEYCKLYTTVASASD